MTETDATRASPPADDAPRADLRARLAEAWRRRRRLLHLRGLCHFLVYLVALILLDLAVDWAFELPPYARVVLLAVNVAVLAWAVHSRWWSPLERYDPVRLALRIERLHPDLNSLLVSYVQLRGDAAASSAVSPALIQAVRRAAVAATAPVDFREIATFRELKRIFILSVCFVLFFAVTSVEASNFMRVLFYRMVNPTSSLRYPRKTQILSVTGGQTVRQGDRCRLEARAGGMVPADGTLLFRSVGGDDWQEVTVTRREGARFVHRFDEVYEDFEYYFEIGDNESSVRVVRVIPPPRVTAPVVTIHFPGYMGRPAERRKVLTFEAPEGSRIEWTLDMDRALAAGAIVREKGLPELKLTVAGGGRIARAETVIEKSFPYRFRWKEKVHGYEYREDVRYFVRAIPDAPPQVTLVSPLQDQKGTVDKVAEIAYRASDRYGLNQAWIVYRAGPGKERRRQIDALVGARLVEKTVSWKLKDTIPGLKEGDTVSYFVEVSDTRTGKAGANLGRSAMRRISILSRLEYLKYIQDRRARLNTELESLYDEEKLASEEIGTLKKRKGPEK